MTGGFFEDLAEGPEIVAAIGVPFDVVAVPLGGEAVHAVGGADGLTLGVELLLPFFIVAMVGVPGGVDTDGQALDVGAQLRGVGVLLEQVNEAHGVRVLGEKGAGLLLLHGMPGGTGGPR